MIADSLKGVIAQNLCRKIGGGRIAALEVLMGSDGMEKLMTRAVAAATQRSKDLAK